MPCVSWALRLLLPKAVSLIIAGGACVVAPLSTVVVFILLYQRLEGGSGVEELRGVAAAACARMS